MKPPKSRKAELGSNATGGEKPHAETAESAEFKMTELGAIPNDWEVKRLGEIGEPLMCKRILKSQTFDVGDVPFYKIGTFGGIADAYISRSLYESFRRKYPYPKTGDVLLSAAGTIGRTVVYDGKDAYFQDSNIVWVDNDEKKVLNDYLYWWYKVILWNTEDGGIVTRLYNGNLKASLIAVPPLAEQRRIAGALSDVDELISALGKLIEKKRNIKTGAMQELLTGKTRLPGFGANSPRSNHSHAEAQSGRGIEFKQTELGPIPMDWEVKRFDDTFEHVPSKPFQLQSSEYREGGRFQVVDQGQMEIVGYTDDDKKLFHVPEGGVIIFGDHTRIVKFRESDFVVGADGTQLLVGKNDCTRFLFYVLQQLDIPNLGYSRHFKYVKEGRYAVPPTLAEQKAIAAVLSDIDAEIAALEADRAKYERIKSGMMQELLTGKTRLKP